MKRLITTSIACSMAVCAAVAQDQDVKPSKEAQEWTKTLLNRAKKDKRNYEAGRSLGRKALNKHMEAKPKSDVDVRITNEGFDLGAFAQKYRLDRGTMEKVLTDEPAFYAFVSFSMEMDAIRKIGADVGKAGGKLVFRGLVENNMRKTMLKIAELQEVELGADTEGNPQGSVAVDVIVDPNLYRKFAVDKVPTFVVADEVIDNCIAEECVETIPPFDKIAGNVTVEYALKMLSEEGDQANKVSLKLLKKVEAYTW